VKFKPARLAPAIIALSVLVLVCAGHFSGWKALEHLERLTFDLRVREALQHSPAVATNLGFVYIDDESIDFVRDNKVLGYNYGLYWPRQVYGRLVKELSDQGAKAVGFDIIFGELRPDHSPAAMARGGLKESDDFFALHMKEAGNVILAEAKKLSPPALFKTNALALGDITTDAAKDSDGVLRRASAFHIRTNWHPALKLIEADPDYGVELKNARIETNSLVLTRDEDPIVIPLDDQGRFDLADVVGLPEGVERKELPFTTERIWNMGIVLAAQELKLDLENPEIDARNRTITLRGENGIRRVLPVDSDGCFYIDWSLTYDDPRLFKEPIHKLLLQNRWRLDGSNNIPSTWAGKLALVGSSALGNDLTDRGATPLEKETLLASAHWNVANSVLTGRFIRRSSAAVDLAILCAMVGGAAFVTWRLRILLASFLIWVMIVGYLAIAWLLYIDQRYWIPVIAPLGGALVMTYVCLVTWRVVFEQTEQRRVKSIFSRIVSPNIVHELLGAEKLSLGGARREVTVLFADIRGFTEFTDTTQERAEEYIASQKLSDAEREHFYDEQARETLQTVNTYLALVADIVKKHDGTLDKYIGDCVMAFWGAPTPNPNHACDCVKAAIEAQQCLDELNQRRLAANRKLEIENSARASAGLPLKPLFPVLTLGSGINTGFVTVGLMGSEDHISNYTVFGREVNLASRLESLSGRGRILISQSTYEHLQKTNPALASSCVALPPATVKGIRSAVKIFEVPWRKNPGTEIISQRPATDTSLLAAKRDTSTN
jgi:Adenylate cyclase, family 3 (some proteins contain HAMP domain)